MSLEEQLHNERMESVEPENAPSGDISNGIEEESPIEVKSETPMEIKPETRTETPVPQPLTTTTTGSNKRIKLPENMTLHEVVGGSSIRRWMNENITVVLQEGLTEVSKEK